MLLPHEVLASRPTCKGLTSGPGDVTIVGKAFVKGRHAGNYIPHVAVTKKQDSVDEDT